MLRSIKSGLIVFCFFWSLGFLPVFSTEGHAAPDRMPAFELREINGAQRTITHTDLKGKVILLNLWASWCPGCKDEMPELMDLQESFGPERFLVVAVNIDNKLDNAVSFMEKFPSKIGRALNFPVLYDQDKIVAKALRPTLLPTSYLIDAEGRIVLILNGSITEVRLTEVREAIRSAMGMP